MSEACRDFHESVVAQELGYLKDLGAVNLTGAYYLEERLANWGCAHFSNSTATQYPLLLDFDLARSVFGLSDVAEHVHFEILRRCDENLLRIPFLNNRWSPETESRAKLLGFPTEPRRIDVARNFPWQFYSYRRYRNALVDFCIEAGSAMRDWVPVDRLEALKRSPVDPFSSASVKMLFGLVGAIFFAERAYIRTRDMERPGTVKFFGNATGENFRDVCEYGSRFGESSLRRALLQRIASE